MKRGTCDFLIFYNFVFHFTKMALLENRAKQKKIKSHLESYCLEITVANISEYSLIFFNE